MGSRGWGTLFGERLKAMFVSWREKAEQVFADWPPTESQPGLKTCGYLQVDLITQM